MGALRPLTPEVRSLVDALKIERGELVLPRAVARGWSDRLRDEHDHPTPQALVEELIAVVASLRRRLADACEGVALEILGWVSAALAKLDPARDGVLRDRTSFHLIGAGPARIPQSTNGAEGVRALEVRVRESKGRPRKRRPRRRG